MASSSPGRGGYRQFGVGSLPHPSAPPSHGEGPGSWLAAVVHPSVQGWRGAEESMIRARTPRLQRWRRSWRRLTTPPRRSGAVSPGPKWNAPRGSAGPRGATQLGLGAMSSPLAILSAIIPPSPPAGTPVATPGPSRLGLVTCPGLPGERFLHFSATGDAPFGRGSFQPPLPASRLRGSSPESPPVGQRVGREDRGRVQSPLE